MNGATFSRVIRSPLTAPTSDADEERDADDLEGVEPERVADAEEGEVDPVQHQVARDHAAEPDDRADREVDAAGDDDEGHADREDRVQRHVLGEDHHVRDAEEVRRRQREEDEDRDQRDEGPRLEQQEQRGVAAEARATAGRWRRNSCVHLLGAGRRVPDRRGGDDRRLVRRSGLELAGDPAVRHHEDPVRQRHHLLEIRGHEQDARAPPPPAGASRGTPRPWRRRRSRATARPSAAPSAWSSAPCRSPPSAGCRPRAR